LGNFTRSIGLPNVSGRISHSTAFVMMPLMTPRSFAIIHQDFPRSTFIAQNGGAPSE
jgi:hypothetical protein